MIVISFLCVSSSSEDAHLFAFQINLKTLKFKVLYLFTYGCAVIAVKAFLSWQAGAPPGALCAGFVAVASPAAEHGAPGGRLQ